MYKMEALYAYRFYEKKDGPFVSLLHFDNSEVQKIGYNAGITNIDEIYKNRKMLEELMRHLFMRQGGRPSLLYPYYAAVYGNLPKTNQLHVRFHEPECLKIPMHAFSKEHVSFTYCQSPRAFTRKDNHPTRRKLLMWEEAEKVINKYPFDEIEDTWIEMQIWDESVLQHYYENGGEEHIRSFQVVERLNDEERLQLRNKYDPYLPLIKSEYFFAPLSEHGIAHAIRVLVLAQELADLNQMNDYMKKILLYSAAYHDIGRRNHEVDDTHGQKSFHKIMQLGLCPIDLDENAVERMRFLIENHPVNLNTAQQNMRNYSFKNEEQVWSALMILKDADTLDRCRFGYVDRHYLYHEKSKMLLHFAFQLLNIYREVI